MKLFLILVLLAVAAAAPSSVQTEEKDVKTANVTVVSQSDVRHVNGTNEWNYALSDGTSRSQTWFPKPSSKPNRR